MNQHITPTHPALTANGKISALAGLERDTLHKLIAWGAIRGPITIIDCGCAFNATRTLEYIHLERVFFKQPMDHIHVSRPFTAYQLQTCVTHLLNRQELWQNTPIIVLSALHLLYDDNLKLGESMRLLLDLLAKYERLSQQSPIILDVAPPPADMPERHCLLSKVLDIADQLIMPDTAPDSQSAEQLKLF